MSLKMMVLILKSFVTFQTKYLEYDDISEISYSLCHKTIISLRISPFLNGSTPNFSIFINILKKHEKAFLNSFFYRFTNAWDARRKLLEPKGRRLSTSGIPGVNNLFWLVVYGE